MDVTFASDVVWEENSKTYSFFATAGDVEIPCKVSFDTVVKNFELQNDDPVWRGQLNAIFMFGKASQLIKANRFEPDGSILITDSDFEESRSIRANNARAHKEIDITHAKIVLPDAPEPSSLRASEAAAWYRSMVALLPMLCNGCQANSNKVQYAWNLKRALRKIAALALYDQDLVLEFYEAFPISDLDNILTEFHHAAEEADVEHAVQKLASVSEGEKRKYPGTIGEAIGMEWRKDHNTTYVMTELGWKLKQNEVWSRVLAFLFKTR